MTIPAHSEYGQVSAADRKLILLGLAPLLRAKSIRLRLFGSRARGDAGSRSDIDLAVIADDKIPPHLLSRSREQLEEAPVPFRVDLVEYRSASPTLRQAIDREGIEWID